MATTTINIHTGPDDKFEARVYDHDHGHEFATVGVSGAVCFDIFLDTPAQALALANAAAEAAGLLERHADGAR